MLKREKTLIQKGDKFIRTTEKALRYNKEDFVLNTNQTNPETKPFDNKPKVVRITGPATVFRNMQSKAHQTSVYSALSTSFSSFKSSPSDYYDTNILGPPTKNENSSNISIVNKKRASPDGKENKNESVA